MIVYHGSFTPVSSPQLITVGRIGDFGAGFYTTSNYAQAQRWAQIRAAQRQTTYGAISSFQFSDEFLTNGTLKIRTFPKADDEWLDFVMANRTKPDFVHDFDLVIGPVANDRVYTCLNAFINGFMDRATVISSLKTYVLADQLLFHTQKSLQILQFLNQEAVPCSPK